MSTQQKKEGVTRACDTSVKQQGVVAGSLAHGAGCCPCAGRPGSGNPAPTTPHLVTQLHHQLHAPGQQVQRALPAGSGSSSQVGRPHQRCAILPQEQQPGGAAAAASRGRAGRCGGQRARQAGGAQADAVDAHDVGVHHAAAYGGLLRSGRQARDDDDATVAATCMSASAQEEKLRLAGLCWATVQMCRCGSCTTAEGGSQGPRGPHRREAGSQNLGAHSRSASHPRRGPRARQIVENPTKTENHESGFRDGRNSIVIICQHSKVAIV